MTLRSISRALLPVALVTAGLFPKPADAEIVTITEIVTTGDAVPDSGGATFRAFTTPSLSGGTVAFFGDTQADRAPGVYTSSGGTLSRVADSTTPIPGGTGTFTQFRAPSIFGGTVVFPGEGSSNQAGIYTATSTGGALTRIADTTTPIPGGSGNFNALFEASITSGTVAFVGHDSINREGIYAASGGTVTRIVDESITMPGTAMPFDGVRAPVVAADGTVAFRGIADTFDADSFQGIYTGTGGALTTIVDSNTTMPGTAKTFGNIGGPSMDADGTVAFRGQEPDIVDPNQVEFSGVYRADGGTLTVVADANTPDPDGSGTLLFFSPATTPISGDNVAFLAFHQLADSTFQEGLYMSIGDSIVPLLFVGDLLSGRTIQLLLPGRNGLEGNTLAFFAAFTDGTQGIYTATVTPAAVPEPSSLALLGLTGVVWAGSRWRRRRRASAT